MDSYATTHPYPRPTDPLSGKWLPISNVTGGDQFEINVLASAPSSNTSVHTFDSSVADSVKRSANTVGIVTDGIVFTCSDDGCLETDALCSTYELEKYPHSTITYDF